MLSPSKISKAIIAIFLFLGIVSVSLGEEQSEDIPKQYLLPEIDKNLNAIDALKANTRRQLDGVGQDPRRRRLSFESRAMLEGTIQKLDMAKAIASNNKEELIQGKGPYGALSMPQWNASQWSTFLKSSWSLVKDARAKPQYATEINTDITPALNLAALTLPQGNPLGKAYGQYKGAQGFVKLNETGVIPALSWVGIGTSMYDLAKKPTLDNYFGSVSSLAGALYAPQIFVLKSLVQGQIQIIDAQFKSLETLMNENTQQTGSQDKFSQYKTGYPVSKALKELEKSQFGTQDGLK